MRPHGFVFLALAGLGCITEAFAQTQCQNAQGVSAGGVCPVFLQGDPGCAEAAQVCGIDLDATQNLVFSPPNNPLTKNSVTVSVISGTNLLAVDDNLAPDNQQLDRPGMDIIIARRNSAYVYCGVNLLHEQVTAPGSQPPNQVTICFAKSSCNLPETGTGSVTSVCSAYNSTSRNADFIQAFQLPDDQNNQKVSLCGCPPGTTGQKNFGARFCDSRQLTYVNGQPSFLSCNPGSFDFPNQPAPLRAVESQGVATIGLHTCTYVTIGGRRLLVDSKTGTLC